MGGNFLFVQNKAPLSKILAADEEEVRELRQDIVARNNHWRRKDACIEEEIN